MNQVALRIIHHGCAIVFIMDRDYRYFLCPDGAYLTLKKLKEIQFGDTVRITEIKTPLVQFQVPKEVHDDPESWEAFSKIFISSDEQTFQENLETTFISYLRSDGKPETQPLSIIYKVKFLEKKV